MWEQVRRVYLSPRSEDCKPADVPQVWKDLHDWEEHTEPNVPLHRQMRLVLPRHKTGHLRDLFDRKGKEVTHEEYIAFARKTLDGLLNLVEAKNRDYTGGSEDAFHNFRQAERVGVEALRGLYIRMLDKHGRIEAWFNRGKLEVSGEGIKDAFLDNIGYSLIALGILEDLERKEEEKYLNNTLGSTEFLDNLYELAGKTTSTGNFPEELPKQEYLSLYPGDVLLSGDEILRPQNPEDPGGWGWETIPAEATGHKIPGSSCGSQVYHYRRPIRKDA